MVLNHSKVLDKTYGPYICKETNTYLTVALDVYLQHDLEKKRKKSTLLPREQNENLLHSLDVLFSSMVLFVLCRLWGSLGKMKREVITQQ